MQGDSSNVCGKEGDRKLRINVNLVSLPPSSESRVDVGVPPALVTQDVQYFTFRREGVEDNFSSFARRRHRNPEIWECTLVWHPISPPPLNFLECISGGFGNIPLLPQNVRVRVNPYETKVSWFRNKDML
ncbi:hypothetical protein CEXT_402961 [Caerostris extrusa]|uniref:Ig-like domain-containing protein n=1 Tax=Caerostris extrusa TaxID=172846 RepID=A0AAV4QUE9_CAEEX|nr:hypothetical protein CEXT_402961 [Caerostris extrusa]